MSSTTDAIETLQNAQAFASSGAEVELLLVRKQGESADIGKLRIGRDIQNEIAEITSNSLDEKASEIEQGEVRARALNIGNTISNESIIECERIENLPDSELFQLLSSRRDHGLTTYSENPSPDFQFVRISEPEGRVLVGLKTYSDVTVVDTTQRLIMSDRGPASEYRQIQNNLLVFEPRFSAFCYDGWVFVIKSKAFESAFEMREEYEQRGREVIEGFTDSGVVFANHDKTTGWLMSQLTMLRAMYEIYENNIHRRITPDMIESSIAKYDLTELYSIGYNRTGEQIELSIDEYSDTWGLLKLLGGKFAEDEILGTQWEIEAGQRL